MSNNNYPIFSNFGSFNLGRFFELDWVGVNITRWSPTGDYNISVIVDLIHQIPHFDIKMRPINNTNFDPSDNEYLESVGILVAIPGFWLILTLLFFLIFFLCRCCDANSKKKKSLGCCKCCLFLFTMVSITIISVGLIGNLRTHGGMVKIYNHTLSISNTVDVLRNETNNVENTLETKIDEDLNKISRKLIGPLVRNYTVLNILQEQLLHMRRNVTKGINRVGEMNSKIERIDLSFMPRIVDSVETIRWPATFAILFSLVFFCFLLLCGTCRHSRCLLILFSVLGLLSIVISFILTSLYLGIAIGGSDFCFNPRPFIAKQFNSMIESTIVQYYLECDIRHTLALPTHYNGPTNNPFRKQLRDIRKSLDGFEEGLFRTREVCDTYCPDAEVKATLRELSEDAKKTQDTISLLSRVTECHDVHMDFLWTMSATCKETLEGVSLMMASSAATGLFFTLLVLCASHTWINIRKKRPAGSDGVAPEETDPFLPPPSATSTATSSGSKGRMATMMRDSYLTQTGGTTTTGTTGRTARFSHTPPQTPHFASSGGNPGNPYPTTPGSRGAHHGHHHGHDQLSFVAPPPSYDQVGSHHHGGHQNYHAGLYGHHGGHHPSHSHHQVHYIGNDPDLMMRGTQATKF